MYIDFTVIVGGVGSCAALSDCDLTGVHNHLFPTVYRVLRFVRVIVLTLGGFPHPVGQVPSVVVVIIRVRVRGWDGAGRVVTRCVDTEQGVRYFWLVVCVAFGVDVHSVVALVVVVFGGCVV